MPGLAAAPQNADSERHEPPPAIVTTTRAAVRHGGGPRAWGRKRFVSRTPRHTAPRRPEVVDGDDDGVAMTRSPHANASPDLQDSGLAPSPRTRRRRQTPLRPSHLRRTGNYDHTATAELQQGMVEEGSSDEKPDGLDRSRRPQAKRTAGHQLRALATILGNVADAVVVVDASATPLVANTAYRRLLTKAGGALTLLDQAGRPITSTAMPLRRAAREESTSTELTVMYSDGSHHPYQVTIRPARLAGVPGGAGIVTFRDVGERRLRQIQERFLALVAHELRAPLSGIQGHAELLTSYMHEEASPDEIRAIAERMYRLAARLNLMLDDLLDAARIASGQLHIRRQTLDLGDVITSTVEIARMQPEAPQLRVDLPDVPVMLEGDADRLSDVVLNLLTNAIKHATGTPYIDLRLRLTPTLAEIDVEDFGPGIPADQLPLIFNRHHQVLRTERPGAASNGLGLGLFIAQQTVAAHGGRIDVESTIGTGTRFTIRLPLR